MTIFIAKAAELIAAWDNPAKHSDLKADIADAMADLLRQIAALGDGEGLTPEQIYACQPNPREQFNAGWTLAFARNVAKTATLPYKAVIADHNRLVRELDIALNGEAGAALQARLCDLVSQLLAMKQQLAASQARENIGRIQIEDDYWLERIGPPSKWALFSTELGHIRQLSRYEEQFVDSALIAALAQPTDLTALHADRKAFIRRLQKEFSSFPRLHALLDEAAERAERGEEI